MGKQLIQNGHNKNTRATYLRMTYITKLKNYIISHPWWWRHKVWFVLFHQAF